MRKIQKEKLILKKSLNLSKDENEIINNISEILNSNNKYNDSITFVYKK